MIPRLPSFHNSRSCQPIRDSLLGERPSRACIAHKEALLHMHMPRADYVRE